MASKSVPALCAVLAVLASSAGAQSLRSLRAQEADAAALAREAAYTSSVCGASISARIDWPSASSWPEGQSLAAACDGALGALETLCRNGRGRGGRVSSFTCAGDGSGPTLSGASFRFGASPGGDSYSNALPYLESAL
jgi:hypothetical protein